MSISIPVEYDEGTITPDPDGWKEETHTFDGFFTIAVTIDLFSSLSKLKKSVKKDFFLKKVTNAFTYSQISEKRTGYPMR